MEIKKEAEKWRHRGGIKRGAGGCGCSKHNKIIVNKSGALEIMDLVLFGVQQAAVWLKH